MNSEQPAYRIEATGLAEASVQWFDTAEEAMRAVNRLWVARATNVSIRDKDGTALTDRQLAVIVMADRMRPANANTASDP